MYTAEVYMRMTYIHVIDTYCYYSFSQTQSYLFFCLGFFMKSFRFEMKAIYKRSILCFKVGITTV